jgi:hypothetical protein
MPNRPATPPLPGTRAGRDGAAFLVAAALALVLARLVLAVLDRTELSTDEAQYWLWGQSLDWGYYSKPPLIGWLIRAATEAFGHSVWAVRLPAVLIHAATAGMVFVIARRLVAAQVAVLAALCYLTMPAVALGSALMTTDTPMLLAAAVALWAQLRLAEDRVAGKGSAALAVVLGLALGAGLLAKHAMLFWLAGMAAAMLLAPAWRLRPREVLIAGVVFLAVIAPHLAWLAGTGFVTVAHVQDITTGAGLSLLRPVKFMAEQALVMGPVLLVALALALGQARRDPWLAGLAVLAVVPLGIVLGQGVRGPVLANWAVLYVVPGCILAAVWLARHPRLAALSLTIGLLVSLALPLGKVLGTEVQRGNGKLLFARYLGHAEVATWALDRSASEGAATLVARDRDLLADLSWFGAAPGPGRTPAIRAVPPDGLPRHHWELAAPFDPARDRGPVLLLLRTDAPNPCPEAVELARQTAGPGFAGGEEMVILRLADPACLSPKGKP